MGKTAQLIALLLSRPPTDSGDLAALVLTPEHLCHQWRSEIARFAGDALSVELATNAGEVAALHNDAPACNILCKWCYCWKSGAAGGMARSKPSPIRIVASCSRLRSRRVQVGKAGICCQAQVCASQGVKARRDYPRHTEARGDEEG